MNKRWLKAAIIRAVKTVAQPTISKSTDGSVSDNIATDATNAHNNMQPYKVVNR